MSHALFRGLSGHWFVEFPPPLYKEGILLPCWQVRSLRHRLMKWLPPIRAVSETAENLDHPVWLMFWTPAVPFIRGAGENSLLFGELISPSRRSSSTPHISKKVVLNFLVIPLKTSTVLLFLYLCCSLEPPRVTECVADGVSICWLNLEMGDLGSVWEQWGRKSTRAPEAANANNQGYKVTGRVGFLRVQKSM